MTKTQLIAALAEDMGSDKKAAAASLDAISYRAALGIFHNHHAASGKLFAAPVKHQLIIIDPRKPLSDCLRSGIWAQTHCRINILCHALASRA